MLTIFYGISNQELADMINQELSDHKTIEIIPSSDKNTTSYTTQLFHVASLDLYHNIILSDPTDTYRVVIIGKVERVEYYRHKHRYSITIKGDDNEYIIRSN